MSAARTSSSTEREADAPKPGQRTSGWRQSRCSLDSHYVTNHTLTVREGVITQSRAKSPGAPRTLTLSLCLLEGEGEREGGAEGDRTPKPVLVPAGSERSHLPCPERSEALSCVCVRRQWCYRCLRCNELFCSATCKKVALSAGICGQDVRLAMTPMENDVTKNTQSACVAQSATSLTIHLQPTHTDSSVRAHSMLGK